MSDDPKRWLEGGGDASDLERDLLRSAGDPEPPDAARGAVWAALANRLPPPPSGGGGAGGGGGIAAGSKIVAGIAITVALVGGAVFVASRSKSDLAQPSTSAPTPSASSIAEPPPVEAVPTATASIANEPKPPPSAPSPRTSGHPRPAHPPAIATHETPSAKTAEAPAPVASISKADALREESALVGKARDALRRGDARGALTLAEEARTRFPNGILVQEREVVAIEALGQSGDGDGASRRANAFLRAFPSSPHAAHVRSYVR